MSGQSQPKTFPARCGHCERPMAEPLVCDWCNTLNPAGLTSDYFTLMGLPRQFDVDPAELQRKFFALSRHVHPDRHVLDNPEGQELALAMSAAVNDAYRTLSDPVLRGAYLLQTFGGKSSADDKSVPDGFLETTMMIQEELADAKAAGDTAAMSRLRRVLQDQHDGLIHGIGRLFAQYEESIACNAVRNELLAEIRQQLNAVSYARKLLSQAT